MLFTQLSKCISWSWMEKAIFLKKLHTTACCLYQQLFSPAFAALLAIVDCSRALWMELFRRLGHHVTFLGSFQMHFPHQQRGPHYKPVFRQRFFKQQHFSVTFPNPWLQVLAPNSTARTSLWLHVVLCECSEWRGGMEGERERTL